MRRYVLILILNQNIDINQPIYTVEKQISKYPLVCWLIFNNPETWNKLDNKYQGDLFRYIQLAPKEDCVILIQQAYNLLSKGGAINENCLQIYYDKLSSFSLLHSHNLYINKTILLDRIWNDYIKDWQFTDQMKYISFLESFNNPISESFDNDGAKRLGLFLGKCCFNNTFSALTFVKKSNNIWVTNLSFCIGVIEGMMSNDTDLCIYRSCLSCVIDVFTNITKEHTEKILNIIDNLQNNTPSNNWYEYEQILEIFNNNKYKIPDTSILDRIEVLIKKYYMPAIELKKIANL